MILPRLMWKGRQAALSVLRLRGGGHTKKNGFEYAEAKNLGQMPPPAKLPDRNCQVTQSNRRNIAVAQGNADLRKS